MSFKIAIASSFFPRYKDDKVPFFVYDFCKYLTKFGHEVYVIAPHSPNIRKFRRIDGINVIHFQYFYPETLQKLAYGGGIPANIKSSNLAKSQFIPYLVSGTKKLYEIVSKYNVDIIHGLWAFPQGLMTLAVKRLTKKPLITTIFGAEVYLASQYNIGPIIRYSVNNAEMATANSNATIKNAIKLGCNPAKIKLIFWGVDSKRFNPENDGSLIRKKYQIGIEQMILCIGRLVERKGQQYLIQAMPEILLEAPETKLVLVGEGPLKIALKEFVTKLGLEHRVIFTGFVPQEELPLFYAATDVFVLPAVIDSRGDTEGGQGLATKEAMATRKPIVATNVGGIPDIIKSEKTGLLVNQKDSHALAKAIIRVLTDKRLRDKISDNGYTLARQELLWEATARKVSEIYSQVINTI